MINVYSRSESELGRLLSNFVRTPFKIGHCYFESVEGWWYWYVTGEQHDHLKSLHGYEAKQQGRMYPRVQEATPDLLEQVYRAKLAHNPRILELLLAYEGEFDHYYVMGGRPVRADKHLWTATLWGKVRDDIKNGAPSLL